MLKLSALLSLIYTYLSSHAKEVHYKSRKKVPSEGPNKEKFYSSYFLNLLKLCRMFC
jgi:hypothetical protein